MTSYYVGLTARPARKPSRTPRTTLRKVNEALKARGHAEELVRGGDRYFWFSGGQSDGWYQSGVYGYNLGDLTVGGWCDERDRLAAVGLGQRALDPRTGEEVSPAETAKSPIVERIAVKEGWEVTNVPLLPGLSAGAQRALDDLGRTDEPDAGQVMDFLDLLDAWEES